LEHKVRRIGPRGKGGAALITAIVFVFFLMLFGLAFYRLGETDIDLLDYDKTLSKALYASEAGIDKVRWMLKESHLISEANPFTNPFSSTYVEANALAIANPTSGDFFPGGAGKPYFRVSMIRDASKLNPPGPDSKVMVQVLGSVDVDTDGEAGLTTTEDGFTFDPDDVNRRFEAYIGLPGTLGERINGKGISAAADAFYAGGIEVSLSSVSRVFMTPDGDSIKDRNGNDGFLYFGSGTLGNWARWDFIFSDPAPTVSGGEIDEIKFPPGIFDESGEYIDDDSNGKPDYFQNLDPRTYAGNQTFTSSPSSDPTAGAEGRRVIYVNGDIIIDRVDFGHLNDEDGKIRNCDWEKAKTDPTFADLAFIATGKITVDRVDCGNVGRLVLVAKDIEFVGDYSTKVNGIAIAYNDITLNGSGCANGILTRPPPNDDRPVKYAAYFLGSMVAGNHINLQDDGWAVIYDENVINGNMYSTTLAKPTLTYERAEAEDFNTTNNWDREGLELKYRQEDYILEDINNAQADYLDVGIDGTPDLMKMYQEPIWRQTDLDPAQRNNHDFAISDGVYCDFTDVGNVFEDSDINIGAQNWDNYTTIHFYMALDNWEKVFGSKRTRRESYFRVLLYDTNLNTLPIHLSPFTNPIYPNNDWVAEPGKVRWKLIRITPQLIDPLSNFDMTRVVRIEFYYNDIRVSWYIDDFNMEYIRYNKDDTTGYGDDGYYYYRKFNGTGYDTYPVQFRDKDANYRYQLYYTDFSAIDHDIEWNPDPSTSLPEFMYFKDTVDPLKSALDSVLKVDRIELPGKPASNDHLEYGLPHCLRLEITNWRELI
jgi:hypothetical protein